jgi:copper chaperone CopZ
MKYPLFSKNRGVKLFRVKKQIKKLKPVKVEGDGIFELDYNLPPRAKELVDKYGDLKIVQIIIRRTPLEGVDTLGNIVTLGNWNKKIESLNIDDCFHLSSVVTLENGHRLVIEKNQLVNVEEFDLSPAAGPGTQQISIKGNGVTLKDCFKAMEQRVGAEQLYKYKLMTANCQDFMALLVTVAGYYSADTIAWIKQPIKELIQKLPSVIPPVVNGITNLAAKLQYLYQQLPSWMTRRLW